MHAYRYTRKFGGRYMHMIDRHCYMRPGPELVFQASPGSRGSRAKAFGKRRSPKLVGDISAADPTRGRGRAVKYFFSLYS